MAVAYDSPGEGTGTTTVTVSCTPVGTIRGCIVFVATANAADDVTGVTADGNAMTETPGSPVADPVGGAEDGGAGAWFYGGNLGSDPFDVVVSGGSASKWAGVILVTADADTELVDDTTISDNSDAPSGTLSLGGVSCFCAQGWWSAINASANVTPLSNWTNRHNHGFGNNSGGVDTYDIVSTTDVAIGFTQTAAVHVAVIGVAVRESAGAATTTRAGINRGLINAGLVNNGLIRRSAEKLNGLWRLTNDIIRPSWAI